MVIRGAHIAVEHLGHTYSRGADPVLSDINLQIEPGQCVALIGRSGCGKSTLLHMMAGLMKPSTGGVLIDGAWVKSPCPEWVMMFQAPCLFPWMTVSQNVGLGLRFAGQKKKIKTRVPELLELVQMQGMADRNVQDLSGGQQQRVALARSLATDPRVLLLDEPFSALDAFTRHTLQREVREITKALEITTVLVTHDVSEAARMADTAIIMNSSPGTIASTCEIDAGTADETAHQQAVSRITDAYEAATGSSLTRFSPTIRPGIARPNITARQASSTNDTRDAAA